MNNLKYSLGIVVAWLPVLAIGCGNNRDDKYGVSITSKLLSIDGALRMHLEQTRLPLQIKGNVWNWSTKTEFEVINWRGVLLEYIHPLGIRNSAGLTQAELQEILEEQIRDVGQRWFDHYEKRAYCNFERLRHPEKSAGSVFVVAAFLNAHSSNWYDSDQQEEPLAELCAQSADESPGDYFSLLLSDGTIGYVKGTDLSDLRPLISESEREVSEAALKLVTIIHKGHAQNKPIQDLLEKNCD